MARADYSRRTLAGNILAGVAAGVADTDAVNMAQLNAVTAGSGISQANADLRYVNVTGDTMTGALTAMTQGGSGAVILDGPGTSNRMLQWTADTSPRWGLYADTGGLSNLILGRYSDAGAYLGTVAAFIRASGEVQLPAYDTATVTPASGWAANSITWIKRASWVVLTFDSLRKTTAPATNDIMFTLPTGSRPVAGTLWISMLGNAATTGGGAKIYLGSVDTTGQVKIRGTVMPPANEQLYGTITYPCD